jgi:hypothetical protein
MGKGKKSEVKEAGIGNHASKLFEKQLKDLSDQELKELLLINMYKLAMVRAQVEALTSIMMRKKIASFEEIWKETHENFKNTI